MSSARERAALVALLRLDLPPARRRQLAAAVEEAGSALAVLERELTAPDGQATLLPADPAELIDAAETDLGRWREQGFELLTVLDPGYPDNLRAVHDRPPLLFVAGRLTPDDARSVAVIGSRRASDSGLASASDMSAALTGAGFTVVSGLAAGIDATAHTAALEAGGRTVAVLGTGLARVYPPEHAELQRRIAARCAVVSQFWPPAPPSRESFPLRNAVMSGLALATVIVEASARSGARVQARLALAHGRPVFLLRDVAGQEWAAGLARRPGVHVVDGPGEVIATVERLNATDTLVE